LKMHQTNQEENCITALVISIQNLRETMIKTSDERQMCQEQFVKTVDSRSINEW
jgi:hypothetical protein